MSLIFWKHWNKPDRATYLAGLIMLGVAFVWLTLVWYRGLANVVQWNVLSELVGLPASLYTVTDGLLTYPIQGQVQTVASQFMPSLMQTYPLVATSTVMGLLLAFSLLLAGVCRLPALPYRLGMATFILLLAVCRFDVLDFFGTTGKWVFIGLATLFGGMSYYFHAFRTATSFAIRTGVFLALLLASALLMGAFAGVEHPAQLALSYALPGLTVLSVAFVMLIAIEPIAAMVWLTSTARTRNDQQSGQPLGIFSFVFISTLYLLNLLLIWLKNTKTVDWDVLTISPFLVVAVSIILGIWGFRRLLEQQDRISFPKAGVGIYLGAAAATVLTMAYAFATANDPLIEVFEDAIVYSHFAMGAVMVLYVVLNFWPIYQQQLPVHRVVYKARLADLSLFRLAGLVGLVTMVASADYFVVRQGQAAMLAAQGDAYMAEGQTDIAQTYYQQSVAQEFQQHKANYALASLALLRNDQTNAALFFSQALLKQPSPQAFIGLSDTYRQTNLFFESVKTLQRGIRAFPHSGELRTNLGYLYSKTAIADSAYYYLQSATGLTDRDDVPLGNLLAVIAKRPQLLQADTTLLAQIEGHNEPAFEANALALRLVAQRDTTQPTAPTWLANVPERTTLDVGSFASLYNYALAAPKPDTLLLNRLQRSALDTLNQTITDELLLATALTRYKANQHPEAFELLTQLADNDPRRRTAYRTTLGLLQLDQGLAQQAAATFAETSDRLNETDTLSTLYRAIALTKLGQLPEAQPFWQTATLADTTLRGVTQVLYDQKPPQTDLEKAFYVAYRPDDANRGRTWETITNPNLKTVAGTYLIDQYLAEKQYFYAQMILSQMGKPEQLSPYVRSLENLSAVRIAAYRNKPAATDSLAKAFFMPQHLGQVAQLRGRVLANVKQATAARSAYETAIQLAPANPAVVAEAANFLRTQKQVKPAYQAVLRALPLNENNPDLLKSYVLLCADQSLFDYAEQGLVKLNFATTPADYQAFEAAYQQKITAVENQRQQFSN